MNQLQLKLFMRNIPKHATLVKNTFTTRSLLLRPTTAATQIRCQSSSSSTSTNTNTNTSTNKLDSLTDEQVDEWLNAITDLRTQFRQNGYTPETSLAPPGKTKLDLNREAQTLANQPFKPTEAQIKEWESLRDIPIPQRTDPVLQHVTNMIMRHGRKQYAERLLSRALYLVFCETRKDPIEILKNALDDLAPLCITRTFNTGVAKAAVIPVPLNQRQRNRIAWKWIVEGANQRASNDFAVRLGEEIVAVYKKSGSGFDKRDQLHRNAVAHRAYIKLK